MNFCFASELPISVTASEATWHQTTRELFFTGNVVVVQKSKDGKSRTLYSNKLCYNQSNNKLIASEKVKIIEPDGTIITTETADLDSHFDTGSLSNIHLITPELARLHADSAKREQGRITTFENAEYSPCKICENVSVTWKLEAEKVEHDMQEKIIKYKNVYLVFKGIKIFYMPYFSHPDPTVKNKSGLLSPSPGVSGALGAYIFTPYLLTDGRQDLTITPMLMTKENPLLATDYRRRFINGEINLGASYTRPKNDKIKLYSHIPKSNRWNLASYLSWHMTDRNKMLVDINRASDTNFLTRYRLNKQNSTFDRKKNLTSIVQFEHFGDNSYFNAQTQSFQTDTPKTTPLVLPNIKYNLQSPTFNNGSYLDCHSSLLSVTRKKTVITQTGKHTFRLSSGLNWTLPHTTSNGHILTSAASARGDAYICQNYVPTGKTKITEYNDKVSTRLFPQLSLDWRYPLLKTFNNNSWILEPRSTIAVAPNKLNRKSMPNEDSRLFTLDDTSLFLPNRFDGLDKVDQGRRVVYGADNHFGFADKQKASLFLGQSYRLDRKTVAGYSQGESKSASDFITRLLYSPKNWLTLFSRAAFLHNHLKSRYSEFGACVGQPKLQFDLAYTHAKRGLNNSETMVSQVSWQVSSKLCDDWQLSISQIRNLQRFKKGILATFAGISYEDDCFTSKLNLYKSHYRDRDIKPDTGFMLQFSFKNLGTFTPSSTTSYPGSILTRIKN